MKPKVTSYLLLFMVVALSGCMSTKVTPGTALSTPEPTRTTTLMPTDAPSLTATYSPSPTPVSPTVTFTQTPTLTPRPTLEPEQAEETISTLLQESVDCLAPCFWGITPGETTLDKAKLVFAHLGLQPIFTTAEDNKKFYDVLYKFGSGLSVSPLLTIEDQIVQNLTVYITPEDYQPGIPRAWLAYSPETLIARYGTPSKVGFWITRAAGPMGFSMVMYFDEVDLIVEYGGGDFEAVYAGESLLFRVCLLTNQINYVRIWMGREPQYPPGGDTALKEVTTLTLEQFAALMLDDPENACVELKEAAFPP